MLSQKQHKDTLTSLKLKSLCDFSDHPTQILSHALPALQKAKGEHLGVSRGMIFKLVDGLHLFYYFQFGDATITLRKYNRLAFTTRVFYNQYSLTLYSISIKQTFINSRPSLFEAKTATVGYSNYKLFFSSTIFPSWETLKC